MPKKARAAKRVAEERRAAACLDFRGRTPYLAENPSRFGYINKHTAVNEGLAIAQTSEKNDPRLNRKLTNFSFHDKIGKLQHVQKLGEAFDGLWISGTILPLQQTFDEQKDEGINCECFGRVESWAISGYEEGKPIIWVSTNISDYECLEPANKYASHYNIFFEKARVSVEVYQRLARSCGGNPDLTLDKLLDLVVRSMSKNFPYKTSVKDFIISEGEFIYEQLIGLDETPQQNDQVFTDLPVLVTLKNESMKHGSLEFLKENSFCLKDKSSVIDDTEKPTAVNEGHATFLTSGPEEPRPNRRLTNFSFHDAEGNLQPVEMMEVKNLSISGNILPHEESFDKQKEKGITCENFGPLESWSISGYEDGRPIIWVSTYIADYECIKPAHKYQKKYNLFFEKANASVEVYKRLAENCGGKSDLLLDEVLASVVRSLSVSENFHHRTSIKEFVIYHGEFIYNQLIGLSEKDQVLTDLPVLIALKDESKKHGSLGLKTGNQDKVDHSSSHSCGPTIDGERNFKLARLRQEEEHWRSMKPIKQKSQVASSNKYYFKINEDELANDYPLPAYYGHAHTEANEIDIITNDFDMSDPDDLPRCTLHSWSLYDSNFRLTSLELLPMKPCVDADVRIYGSGKMSKDDGNLVSMDKDENLTYSSCSSGSEDSDGTLIYLNGIKEWMVEFVSSEISISIRTDVAWYKLGKPSQQYAPWCEPILKTARLAESIIDRIKNQSRASRLSFGDIVKWVSEFGGKNSLYISRSTEMAERYLVVHGPIILQMFSENTDDAIKKCAFVTGLSNKMEQWHHTKWLLKKKSVGLEEEKNPNPQATMNPAKKAMPATVTPLVNKIWNDSFHDEICWIGEVRGKLSSGECLYQQVIVKGNVISVGDFVLLKATKSNVSGYICFVEYMFERLDGKKIIHGRKMLRGSETILLYTANEREVFLTSECSDFKVKNVKEKVVVKLRNRPWGYQYRKENAQKDKIDDERARENKCKGSPVEYYCKSLYSPEKCAFFCLAGDQMGIGDGVCHSCRIKESQEEEDTFMLNSDEFSFKFMGAEYRINDFLYVAPKHVPIDSQVSENSKSYVVCQVLEIEAPEVSRKPCPVSTKVKVCRFYRPEDISTEKAYHSDIQEVYYTDQTFVVPVEAIKGKCEIRKKEDIPSPRSPVILEHIFFCENLYDLVNQTIKQLPADINFNYSKEADVNKDKTRRHHENRLATLDIFSGCGGLSEGLEQAGVSLTKWAIEYDETDAKAFSLNHPEALMFVHNCYVILRAIMSASGDQDECISSSPEAAELAEKLSDEEIQSLPKPEQVDFIVGGPPCQGFSSLNRYPNSEWSKSQRKLIRASLSFADYFRPKFFLLENVRNFVTFKEGKHFKRSLATLLGMGYQVRFGVLEGGAYGIAQARNRAFIWAAAPGEILPEWPEPMHVFAGSKLKISLPGNSSCVAVPSTSKGAPFRTITVQDSIGDLPAVPNGASATTMEYQNEPVSWYQKKSRQNSLQLTDHISKEMAEKKLIRCQRIPKRPGAGWRDLPDEEVQLSTGETVEMIPDWLRDNQWNGQYGRVDWEGKFQTALTNPEPEGRVGTCIHPDQDRILTAREYARSQGFPDTYKFSGNILHKHRQIGNAVPPPLAYALGIKLKEAVELKQEQLKPVPKPIIVYTKRRKLN
ncbi:hypothetical protein ACFE04_023560 [Oxalis oulophora]